VDLALEGAPPRSRPMPIEGEVGLRGGDLELRALARQQEAVAAIGALALDVADVHVLFAEAARRTALALEADLAHLLERRTDETLAALGEAGPAPGTPGAASAASPALHALATGRTVVTADVALDDRFEGRPPPPFASGVSVVVRGRAGPYGVLCAHWRAPRGFSNDEVHFVEGVAHILSSALSRAQAEAEAHEVQTRLALSERMASIDTLAGGVAHELNNPLSCVAANLAFAESRLAERSPGGAEADAELLEALRDARAGAERMRTIVRDLQIFSRGGEERPGAVRLEPVLDSCVAMAWSEIRHRARLVKDYGELPPVCGAEGRLAQVFLNLVLNAAQAIPEGAADRNEIRLSARATPAGAVCVEVTDTGGGIAPDHLLRIFDPFFTTKPLGVGTGLGLSICHGIVTALGGSIEVESAPGTGSTFRVLLPAAHPAVAPAVRTRVLVVDDDPLVAGAVRRALGGEHDVTVVSSGRAAIERIRGGEVFHAVVPDLLMPELTGIELHDAIERHDPGLAARTLFMTGGAFTPAARAFAERMGPRLLSKPFELATLRAAVARLARPAGR